MTLHAAIIKVLQENMRPMTSSEIAPIINKRKLYIRNDGDDVKPQQISARINHYPKLFIRNGPEISLVHWFDTHQ
ncbi:MAG: hypothetical protein CVU46_11630 [Chloroflexi bacterium HGW-Chloroflexi-8]|jgi:hypothetical protein|nr:MAG: hypothetical protein CVU46_11630 [Chloroflexi bacterium HGW-Chloroflexi-8]